MKYQNKIIWLLIFTQLVVGCRLSENGESVKARRAKQTAAEQKKKNAQIKAMADEKAKAEAYANAKADADQLNTESLKEMSINQSHCDSDIKSMQFKINDQKYELVLVDQIPNGKTDKQKVKTQALLNWNESKKEIEVIHNDISDKTQTTYSINFNKLIIFLKKENNKSEILLKLKDVQDSIILEKSEIKKATEVHNKICELIKSSPLALLNRDLQQLKVTQTDNVLVQNLSVQLRDKQDKNLGRISLLIKSEQITLVMQKNDNSQETLEFKMKIGAEDKKLKDVGEIALNEQNQVVLKLPKNSLINTKLGITQEEETKVVILQVITTLVQNSDK